MIEFNPACHRFIYETDDFSVVLDRCNGWIINACKSVKTEALVLFSAGSCDNFSVKNNIYII